MAPVCDVLVLSAGTPVELDVALVVAPVLLALEVLLPVTEDARELVLLESVDEGFGV